MATAPQAAMEMPQEGANPFADPNTMAVYEQMRQTVSPKEFGDQMLASAEQAAPEEVAKFRSALEQIQLPPEALDLLNNMVDEILANPEKYAEVRAKYKEMGAPDEILPEQFDAQFFAALNMAVDQMIGAPTGAQAFAKGGIAELKPVAKAIASYGRNGDTMLAHITPAEARMLRRKGGSGTINPVTGLPEFFLGFIGKAFKAIGNAVKSFASSTVGRIITTVALGFFLGPAAASFMGATSTAAVAAVSGFVGSAGSTLLAGGNLSQALKAGAMGGLTAGVGAGVMGGADAFTAGSYTGPTTVGGQFDKFTGAISPTAVTPSGIQAPIGEISQPYPAIRPDEFGMDAQTYANTPAVDNRAFVETPAGANEQVFGPKKITMGGGLPEQVTMPNGAVVTQNAANPFAPTATNYGAFGEAPLNASAQTAVAGNTVAPPINTQPPVMPSAATGNAIAPAIGNPMDATQFQGSLAKMAPGSEPGFFDSAKDFYNRNISPSGIQQQGMGAAQDAAAKAVTDLTARIPDATPAMREAAYQNAYKAAMPGVLSTYGPMTAVGIGAIGAFGGFSPKAAPISPYQSLLTGGPGSAKDLMSKNPNRYYVQNLPGVNYYDGSVIKPAGMAEGGLADIAKMGRDGDTMLAHINPAEAQMLKRMGGRGTINPKTGLPEFAFGDDTWGTVSQDYGSGWDGFDSYGDLGSGFDNQNDPFGQNDGSIYTGGAGDDVPEITITGDRADAPVVDWGDLLIPPGDILTPVISDGSDVPEITIIGDRPPQQPPVIIDTLPPVVLPPVVIEPEVPEIVITDDRPPPPPEPEVPEIVITDDRPPKPPVEPPIVLPPVVPPLPPIKPTCPAPEMRILLANGDLKAAGDLQVGDVVKTQHETTLAWGEHPVTHVSIVPNAARLKFTFDNGEFVGSHDHKFFKAANEWVTAKDVVPGDMLSGKTVRSIEETATGDVVRITIDDAHTYICEGLLSHNKSPLPPDEPPVVPPVVEPPVVKPPVLPPVVITPPYVPPVVVEPPYVPPTVPKVPVVPIGNASTDPRVAGVPGGSYLFTRNTPTFPAGVLSRTMSPYTGGITGLMDKMVIPPQVPTQTQASTQQVQGMPPVGLNMGGIAGLAQGGYPRRTGQIDGPGTATSDSIPAMLSDGEFVMTAKAVRGAGKGDRRAGAKRMYALMNQLEKNAARG